MATVQPPNDVIVEDLADNGVAGSGDQSAIASVVDEAAAEHDLQLSVVSLPDGQQSEAQLQELAQQLSTEHGGVVLVLNPESAAGWSQDEAYNSEDVTTAVQNLPPGDDAEATQAFVNSLTASGPPWGWIIGAAVVLVVVVAIVGRWWERRRRREKDAAALAAEGQRLRSEVSGMADDLLRVEPHVTVAQDDELSTEYNQLAAEYRELTHAVQHDPDSRPAAEELGTRVREAREQLDRIRSRLDV